ncbi:hypothetical protein A2U01_0118228, partial [Trifolium medium]|nr:hypothetical protein [Trifolium medium]
WKPQEDLVDEFFWQCWRKKLATIGGGGGELEQQVIATILCRHSLGVSV